ncbi:uncharacterized protein VTP21DRAFT_9280 [Calcarisporiella thermophila]|uniref:uncharacterized protein n=1 Tax=Calcarisporiella thermophila TaxID=911321 RepID=UPI0037424B1A
MTLHYPLTKDEPNSYSDLLFPYQVPVNPLAHHYYYQQQQSYHDSPISLYSHPEPAHPHTNSSLPGPDFSDHCWSYSSPELAYFESIDAEWSHTSGAHHTHPASQHQHVAHAPAAVAAVANASASPMMRVDVEALTQHIDPGSFFTPAPTPTSTLSTTPIPTPTLTPSSALLTPLLSPPDLLSQDLLPSESRPAAATPASKPSSTVTPASASSPDSAASANPVSKRRRRLIGHFPCPHPGCEKVFHRPYNLKSHMRTHTSERPYVCGIDGCTKSFARRHDRNRHCKQVHFRKCNVCGVKMPRLEALNRHLAECGGAKK